MAAMIPIRSTAAAMATGADASPTTASASAGTDMVSSQGAVRLHAPKGAGVIMLGYNTWIIQNFNIAHMVCTLLKLLGVINVEVCSLPLLLRG